MERLSRISSWSTRVFLPLLVGSSFQRLQYISAKHAHVARKKACPPVTEEEWPVTRSERSESSDKITTEHKEEGAREQLAAGWKAWLAARNQAAVEAAAEAGPGAATAAGQGQAAGWRS